MEHGSPNSAVPPAPLVPTGTVQHPDDSSSKDNINPGKDQFELSVRKLTCSLREKMLVESDDLRHVCNRVLGKSGKASRQQDIPWGSFPSKVAGERHADYCGDTAPV